MRTTKPSRTSGDWLSIGVTRRPAAGDKVAKHERWGREDDGAGSNKTLEALDRIAEVLKDRKLSLEVSVRPSDPQPAEMGQVLEGDYESR